ncbi:MAG TPA: Ig-like domain repeat protein, partial [Bryobacteraceae bacterium]
MKSPICVLYCPCHPLRVNPQNVYLCVLRVLGMLLLAGGLACAQTGVIGTYAGTGSSGPFVDGVTATSATLFGPAGLAVDSNGNLYIADTNNSRIRKVSGGIMTTVVGGGMGADGLPALEAQLFNPCDVKVDSAGNIYISESCVVVTGSVGGPVAVMNRVRRVDAATGIIRTIAGGLNPGFGGDGGPPGSASQLNTPGGLAIDGSGSVYIADSGNNRVRRIDGATGIISTVAGNGVAAFSGDGGPATSASLNYPSAVAVDSAGTLYIADGSNGRIRRVDAATGIITTLAGAGGASYNGDGIAATSANLGFPYALQVNGAGNLLLADVLDDRVRLVDTSTGLIWTIAGNGPVPPFCCGGGDGGPATRAWLNVPSGVALSPMGPLFIAEHAGQRIRQVALSLVSTAVNVTPSGANVPTGSPLTLTAALSVMTGSPANVTGSVVFLDAAGSLLGNAPVVNGSASFTTSSLQRGTHSLSVQYFGDSIFGPSISAPVSVTIADPQSSVALVANPSPAAAGQPVTLTATVTPSSATGTVIFFNGTTSLGMVNISNGAATLTGVTFSAGSYSLTAQYTGNINLPSSTSPAITLNVKAVASVVLTSSVNPSTPGQAVTFTAAVNPSTAGGSVQLLDNGTVIASSFFNAVSAIFSISTLTSGTHSLTASYSGDANDTSATSAALTQTVLGSSSVVVTSSQNPSPVGGPITFTATVTPANATGTVQFLDGTTVLGTGTVAGASASFTTSTLAQGTHYSITAVYSGDANNVGSTSPSLIQTVKPTATVTLASSLNPSTVGQTVTFTANVNPSATGSVQFLDGAAVLATVPISSGAAAFSTFALTVGAHSISANYSGDTNYFGTQSAALTETVNLVVTTTTLAATPNPAFVGGAVSLLATVTPATATGTVQFLDGTTVLGTGTLSNGSASFATSALTQGAHSITAVYGGDASNAGSTSAAISQAMKLSAGMTTGLNPSPGVTGQNVTITANVVAAATGTVTFSDGNTVLATVAVASGSASYSTTTLTQGAHTLGVSYSGDATYMSQSTTFPETILGLTSIVVASNANPAAPGQNVTFTATVTPATATGNVQFYDGQNSLVIFALSGGTASYSTSALTPGNHSITANYLGSSDYAPSFSNTLAQGIKTNTSVALTSTPNPERVGGVVTFSITVTPATATGTVKLFDGTTLIGENYLTNGLTSVGAIFTQGTHPITAIYGGDAFNAASTSAILSQSIKLVGGLVDVIVTPNPPVAGQTATIKAIMNAAATGTVTCSDGNTVLATVPVVSGVAPCPAILSAGTHTLNVSYSGDANYMSASTSFPQNVAAATSIVLTSNANPAAYGQSVTFTATVTPATATGNVQFYDGQNSLILALNGGTASYSTSILTPGTHSVTANYLGNFDYGPSFSNTLAEVIKTNTSTTVASTVNPSVVGSAVTFNAAVSPATATGVVQFLDGATALGTATLANGSASFTTSALTQGAHSITAVYAGDAANNGSSSPVLSQSAKSFPGLGMSVTPNPILAGQTVTIGATMNAAATGTVTFTDGSTALATVTVASGSAFYSTSSLAAGVHTLGISYSGDANYMSGGDAIVQTVLAASSTGLTSNVNPASPGQNVTFTATVTPAAATGNVQFFDGQTPIGVAALSGGAASFSTFALPTGTHSITANYLGNSSYAPSSSNPLAEVITRISTSVGLLSSWNPSLAGGAVTFSASVAPGVPTGTVQFRDGAVVLGTGALSNGSASFTTSALAQGAHSITAVYTGDAAFSGSASAPLSQSVKLNPGLDVALIPNPPIAGRTTTIRATMNAAATGTVTFSDGNTVLANVAVVSGVASCSTVLSADVHTLSISYFGDATYMSAGTSF